MKKLVLLLAVLVIAVIAFFMLSSRGPYDGLKDIETRYGLADSIMPISEEKTKLLREDLKELKNNLKNDSSKEAEAVRALADIRIDLADSALKLFLASKNSSAMSPFSNNCLPGKPAFEAKKLIDDAVAKAKISSERMKLFFQKYSAEAAKFGIKNNYAKDYSDFLEVSSLSEKKSLDTYC